jgi:glycosyltransferase involved in cell wall biosynthesis
MEYLLSSSENVLRVEEMGRHISFLSDLRAFWKFYRFLTRERPEIVHTHTAKAGALGRIAARLAGVPIIVHTYHGHIFHSYFGRAKTRLYLAIEKALGVITTQVVAISESQRDELCDRYRLTTANKITVIPNGFHFTSFSSQEREKARKEFGIEKDAFVFVWAGRMAPVKDVGLLGQVIHKAASSSSKAFFLVVGDGEEMPRLKSLLQDFGNVKLLGWWRDMDQIWRIADAAILTSRNEGTPTSLIEAMAAGLPFVATNVGGVQDLSVGTLLDLGNEVGHRAGNAFLVNRTPEALFYCVQELVNNRDASREMGRIGSAFVRARFPADRLIADITKLYNSLMEQRSMQKQQPVGCSTGRTEADAVLIGRRK